MTAARILCAIAWALLLLAVVARRDHKARPALAAGAAVAFTAAALWAPVLAVDPVARIAALFIASTAVFVALTLATTARTTR